MYLRFHFCVFFCQSFGLICILAARSLCPAQTWNSQFCSRHSFQENPEFISRPKAKPKRSQKRSLISKKRPFTRPGPTLNEAAARDMQNNPHGPQWHIQIPDLPRTRPDAHVVQMHNAQINFLYCWQSILNKYTTHGIEILDVSLWKEVHSWFDKSAFGISVNVLISYGDCTTMIDKIIKSFAKRSRNTKSEASNDSPLSGLFILPIPHIYIYNNPLENDGCFRRSGFLLGFTETFQGWTVKLRNSPWNQQHYAPENGELGPRWLSNLGNQILRCYVC